MIYFFQEIHMENQINAGDQNTQQIGQNVASPLPVNPEKPKTNYLMIGGIVLACFVIFGFGGYYLGKQSNKIQNTTTNNEAFPTNTPVTSTQSILPSTTPSSSGKSNYAYGSFSFSYPKTWQLSENTTNPSFFVQNKMTGSDIQGFFDHVVLLQNGDYYLLIGIDTHKTGAEVGGIYVSDTDYQDYIKNCDEISIQGKRFLLWKNHTSLTQWNDPQREAGIYALGSLSEYIPNKVTNNENKTFNGYDDYIQNKNSNSYMFIKLSKTGSGAELTPASIQSDIKEMLESVKW